MNTTPETLEDETRFFGTSRNQKIHTRDIVWSFLHMHIHDSEDGHNTRVTIETRSENLMHGTSEDIRLQMEKDHEIDGPLNAKRILKFVEMECGTSNPLMCPSYHIIPITTIELATPEKVQEIVEDFGAASMSC